MRKCLCNIKCWSKSLHSVLPFVKRVSAGFAV